MFTSGVLDTVILKISNVVPRSRKNEGGFTLIELLIVITILAILAAIAVPTMAGRVGETRDIADTANVHMLQTALGLYVYDHPEAALGSDFQATLVNAGYLRGEVESPGGKTYELEAQTVNGRPVYRVVCR